MARALSTLRFVPLDASHIPHLLAIEAEANSAPWSERSFQNELNHPHGQFLVGVLEGEVIAYGGIWLLVDEAHVTTVAVRADKRRLGIGRRLVVELIRIARERGMVCATLEVRSGNTAAIELYQSLGFTIAARRKGYYPDNREDALVMWRHGLQDGNPHP